MLNSTEESKVNMSAITIKNFYIKGRLVEEACGDIYKKLGLKVRYRKKHLKISSTANAKIYSIDKHVHVYLYDSSIVKLLIEEGFVLDKNKETGAVLEMMDELGNKIMATFMPRGLVKKIAVLTSGGDAPGMNGAIRAIVRTAKKWGTDVYGVYYGYDGLIKDSIVELDWDSVGYHSSHGGTFLSSARSTKFLNKEGRKIATYNLAKRGIEGLIVLGGDGSIKGSIVFKNEWKQNLTELIEEEKIEYGMKDLRLKIIAIPASIDNDISNTDMTLGADSALNRAVDSITSLTTTMLSHKRSFIIEVMGKRCGWIALMVGLAVGSDFIFTPEAPHENWKDKMIEAVRAAKEEGKIGSFIVVSEGALDINGNKIEAAEVRKEIEDRLGIECRVMKLGHIQRGGRPSAYDRILSTILGCKAVERMLGDTDDEPLMMTLRNGEYSSISLLKVLDENENMGMIQKKMEFDRILEMRGKLFNRAYKITEQLRTPTQIVPRNRVIGVVHEGGRSGGMNVALNAIVRYAVSLNQEVKVILDGFDGLLQNQVKTPRMYDYTNGIHDGGSMIGSSFSKTGNISQIYKKLIEHKIDSLIIIGGSEATRTAGHLKKHITKSEKKINIVIIPASVDNDVPFTDMCLGVDTALNCISIACDFLRLSSLSMKKTVFIVEVPGEKGGYLTVFGGIATGAFDVFIPERKYKISHLSETAERLKYRFKNGNRHGIILLKNQVTYNSMSVDSFSRIITTDSDGMYDAKFSVLGYLVEGGSPSPYDRIYGTIFGIKAVDILLNIDSEEINSARNQDFFVGMIGSHGQSLKFTDIEIVSKTHRKIKKGKIKPRWTSNANICRSME